MDDDIILNIRKVSVLFNSLEEYIESANADIYDFKFQFDEKMYMDIEKYCEYRKCHNDIVNIGLHFFLKNVRPMLLPVMRHSTSVA